MGRKAKSGIMLVLLLVSMLTLVPDIQSVEASGTIYIRADGSIDPPTAPIQRDGDLYTLTGNITSDTDGIVIERNNMTLNGADYTIQGTGAYPSKGIYLSGRSNITIRNMEIRDFDHGVYLYESLSNIISENNITDNFYGIHLYGGSYNFISRNNITDNESGIYLSYSSYNTLSENVMNINTLNLGLEGKELRHFMHSIDVSNLINGKPIYYLVNQTDLVINSSTHSQVGCLALVNCANITVEALTLTNGDGITMTYTIDSTITRNDIKNTCWGIYLDSFSNSNIIEANSITNNIYGICLSRSSSDNSIAGNNVTSNTLGIYLTGESNNNILSENSITNSEDIGITLFYSSNITLRNKPRDL